MRISDWSSDVCSSDLVILPRSEVLPNASPMMSSDTVNPIPDSAAPPNPLPIPTPAGKRPRPRRTAAREIGRASCRDRVDQYVSLSVVAVSSQTKHEHKYSSQHHTTDISQKMST